MSTVSKKGKELGLLRLFPTPCSPRRAGINSNGFFSEVESGRRQLPQTQEAAFAKAMDLGDKEHIYFGLMAAYGHAKTDAARKYVFDLMLQAIPGRAPVVADSLVEAAVKSGRSAISGRFSILSTDAAGPLDPEGVE